MSTYQGLTAEQWANQYAALYTQTQDDLRAIAAKRQRDREEQTDEYRLTNGADTVHRDGLTNYDQAQKLTRFYDTPTIEHRTTTPWKVLTPTTETDEGN